MQATEFAAGLTCRGIAPPLQLRAFKLIAFDMDSTLINIECVDELAAVLGQQQQVCAITAAAMRGELSDYKESLRQRVALLKGVTRQDMQQVYQQRVQLNPGAKKLIDACQQAGLKILLVSGGFTFFTDRLCAALRIDYCRANQLEIINNRLTGRLLDQPWGDICDGAEKRRMLLQTCATLAIDPKQSIAVGDGANDLAMMDCAGLSVAYHAKPGVRESAKICINSGGLDRLLEVVLA